MRSYFIYNITVDESGLVDSNGDPLAGNPGYLDLQFDPSGGTGTLVATVQALAFNDATQISFYQFPPPAPTRPTRPQPLRKRDRFRAVPDLHGQTTPPGGGRTMRSLT